MPGQPGSRTSKASVPLMPSGPSPTATPKGSLEPPLGAGAHRRGVAGSCTAAERTPIAGGRLPYSDDDNDWSGGSAPWRHPALAPLLAILSCVLYCCNGELLQALQKSGGSGGGPSPLLNLGLCHLGGLAFAPFFLGHSAPVPVPRPAAAGASTGETWKTSPGASLPDALASQPRTAALLFAAILMGYNYAWLLSTRFLPAGLTNAVFQVSVAFVYLANTQIFGESVTVLHLCGVMLALAGSALASGSLGGSTLRPSAVLPGPSSEVGVGVALALLAAMGVTLYQVLFRYLFGHLKHNVRFLAYFGSWVSVWHLLLIPPLLVAAHVLGLERFEMPHGTFALIGTLVSAAVASTVNALYLCIIMWGSPMLLPCASAFSVPLTVALDAVLHKSYPTGFECLGHCLVVASVVLILELYRAVPPLLCRRCSTEPFDAL